jgi:glucose/mannose-6-phosphate isomerase
MRALIQAFPSQLREATVIGQQLAKRTPAQPITSAWLIGLGGSAFGGEIVRNYTADLLPVPFTILRGYTVPVAVGKSALVIVSSYSGNTEETLDAAEAARLRGAQIICITSGGKLAAWATEHNFTVLLVPGGNPPRSACGYSIVLQLHILASFGLIPSPEQPIQEAIDLLDHFDGMPAAGGLAKSLMGNIGIIYSSDANDAVAIRLRQQINENSKRLCWHNVIPEMNHNELVGWEGPQFVLDRAAVLLLRSHYEHPRVATRFGINEGIISQKTDNIIHAWPPKVGRLAELLYMLHLSDWVSVLLAENEGVDPTPVNVIDHLKSELARR